MELFRELLRHFGGACVDEYYCNGVWDLETLKLDTHLIRTHLVTAGSSYLIKDLADVPEVELPAQSDPPVDIASPMATPLRGLKRSLSDLSDTAKGKSKGKSKCKTGKEGVLLGKGSPMPGKGAPAFSKAAPAPGKGTSLAQKGTGGKQAVKGSNAVAQWRALAKQGLTGTVDWKSAPKAGKGSTLLVKGGNKGAEKGFSKASGLAKPGMKGLKGSKGTEKGKVVRPPPGKQAAGAGIVPPSMSKASSPAFSKAGAATKPRLGKFARRAKAGVRAAVSEEVREAFLDADGLD